jgi:hypothetical protein
MDACRDLAGNWESVTASPACVTALNALNGIISAMKSDR